MSIKVHKEVGQWRQYLHSSCLPLDHLCYGGMIRPDLQGFMRFAVCTPNWPLCRRACDSEGPAAWRHTGNIWLTVCGFRKAGDNASALAFNNLSARSGRLLRSPRIPRSFAKSGWDRKPGWSGFGEMGLRPLPTGISGQTSFREDVLKIEPLTR